jgi:Ca-activated chloride channel homolog
MKFAEPFWLVAGAAVVVLLWWLYRRFDLRQRAALAEFASSHLLARLTASFSPGRRRVKRLFFVAALFLVFAALARPQYGYHWEEEKQRGIDILFAIDTSKSMLTQDVTPNRLMRAKLAISDLLGKLESDRVGLIAFAGDAFLQAPLTLDYDAFRESLDAVDTNVIPRGGTDVASAIQEADAAFGKESKNKKILVLITDGEDLEAQGIDAAKAAAKNGLTIYTIGVGSADGGLIPVATADGGTDFLKDDTGQFVKSHLDESTLKQIAEATGGMYQPLGQQGQGLQAIYDQVLASLPKQDLASKREQVYDERFQWPLALGLGCLIASMLIGTRRRIDKPRVIASKRWQTAATVSGVALLAMVSHAQASAQSAERAYKKGDYSNAEKQYEQAVTQQADSAPLQYNWGASAYKTGEYDKALPAFQKALSTDDMAVQQQAYYDMGNTQYRLGQKTEKSAPQDTIKTWQSAVQSYDAVLKLKPDDVDAKFNRDFVQKKLEQLQKQQPQQNKDQQKQDQEQDQKDQQNQQDQQQNQNQNQQDQTGQDQKNQQQSGSPQNQQNKSGNQQDQSQEAKNDGQKQQNKSGQPDKQKDQSGQQQTADNKDQQTPNGQDQKQSSGQQNSQTAQNANKPAGQTVPDKNQSQPQGNTAETEAVKPGELSKEEAKALLNSLKDDEHALPVTVDARNGNTHPDNAPVGKDW